MKSLLNSELLIAVSKYEYYNLSFSAILALEDFLVSGE